MPDQTFVDYEYWTTAEKWFIVSLDKDYEDSSRASVMIRASPIHEEEEYTEICLRFTHHTCGRIEFAHATCVAFTFTWFIPPRLFTCEFNEIDANITIRNDELRSRSQPTLPPFSGNIVADNSLDDSEKIIVTRLLGAMRECV